MSWQTDEQQQLVKKDKEDIIVEQFYQRLRANGGKDYKAKVIGKWKKT